MRYGKWNAVGLVSYFIGLACQIPFMISPMFESPLAKHINHIDISWLVGFVATAIVFLVLERIFGAEESPQPARGRSMAFDTE